MYGVSLLKPRAPERGPEVVCPVRGCDHAVPAQEALFRATPEYICPVHKIAIARSTFAYERAVDNLLWTDEESLRLLVGGRRAGNDARFKHDGSERAVAWNVFRWLEISSSLGPLLEAWTGHDVVAPRCVYWGYSPQREGAHLPLLQARTAFGEDEADVTEPAVLIECEDLLVVVDPSLQGLLPGAAVSVDGSRYRQGAKGWASEVLATGAWEELSGDRGFFDLLRLWLVGSLMAERSQRAFLLVRVEPSWSNPSPSERAASLFRSSATRVAGRATREEVAGFVRSGHHAAPGGPARLSFLREKSAGYGADGVLRRAFALEPGPAGAVRA